MLTGASGKAECARPVLKSVHDLTIPLKREAEGSLRRLGAFGFRQARKDGTRAQGQAFHHFEQWGHRGDKRAPQQTIAANAQVVRKAG